jgi:hypothetical protein
MSTMTATADILGRCDRRERDLKHKEEETMHIKVTYWTGKTGEYVGLTMAQVIAIEYPEFATTNESENGWLTYPYEDEDNYGFAQVYNRHGDWCCTVETIKED